MDEVILTEERKKRILGEFKDWSGGKYPWECSYEFQVQVFLENCLYDEDNRDSEIIYDWLYELCHEDKE